MSQDYFSKLPYCLRTYVEGKNWTDFREVQKKSFEVLFNSEDHLLISSGTSSGKTEAALFPVITDLYNTKPRRISALYVSPLIALIDDQFGRVSNMLKDSGIDLFCWHGDISSSMKRRVIERGEGILQITPESLEGIVNRNFQTVSEIFSELKYVIIDEVHTFMNSDRGLHLLCELGMIEKLSGSHPRRIGLSATLSDFDLAKNWLKSGTSRDVKMVECNSIPKYDLKITFDMLAPKKSEERQKSLRRHYSRLFDETNDYNCIVFTNNRTNVENVVKSLKKINHEKGISKDIWAHHSSVSKEYRKLAEEKMKDRDFKCTAVATSTLELGIDVGDLDRVIHINAPQTVSSFVQKFGRSGRRNGNPCMICFCDNNTKNRIADGIEMDLIKAIAEAELVFTDHWIEPIRYSKLPYSLLFQQTLSHVKTRITSSQSELIEDVLSLSPFKEITEGDYKILLDYMCECNILDYNSYYGTYCIGDRGDNLTRRFDFGINFQTIKEMDVYYGKERIGTIQEVPYVGQLIQLAGSSWQVDSVDSKYLRIHVKKTTQSSETFWKSGRTDLNTRLMREMFDCLNSDKSYEYLDNYAVNVLNESRKIFLECGFSNKLVHHGGALCLYPWLGTVEFDTLFRILKFAGIANSSFPPYCIIVKEGTTLSQIRSSVCNFIESYDPLELITDEDVMYSSSLGKYATYVPTILLKRQFIRDRLNFDFEL